MLLSFDLVGIFLCLDLLLHFRAVSDHIVHRLPSIHPLNGHIWNAPFTLFCSLWLFVVVVSVDFFFYFAFIRQPSLFGLMVIYSICVATLQPLSFDAKFIFWKLERTFGLCVWNIVAIYSYAHIWESTYTCRSECSCMCIYVCQNVPNVFVNVFLAGNFRRPTVIAQSIRTIDENRWTFLVLS